MNNLETLETIENYLNGQLSTNERAQFESALRTNPAVADALAFYVMTKEAARRQAREQRIAEIKALRQTSVSPWSAPMRWAAAASVVLLLGLGWFFFQNGGGSFGNTSGVVAANATQRVDRYIAAEYDQLTLRMGGSGPVDSLTQGVGLYNGGQFAQAEAVFQNVLTQQPNNDRALKFAGLTALRQAKYDQAIERFSRLSQRTDLLDTSGPFLEALARIKRNQPVDKEQAKKLLERVIRENLDGKAEAEQLLNEL